MLQMDVLTFSINVKKSFYLLVTLKLYFDVLLYAGYVFLL